MAVIDAKLLLCSEKEVGASVISDVIDLGSNGAVLHPLFIAAKLTTGNTAGTVSTVKVQSSDTEAFSSPVDEMTVNVPASVVQTRPCNLAQFFCPIKPGNRYMRLVFTGGSTTPQGGKLWAYMSPDVQVPV